MHTHPVFQSKSIEGYEDKAAEIRAKASSLLDAFETVKCSPDCREMFRYLEFAKTSLEQAVMWSMKAISRAGEE